MWTKRQTSHTPEYPKRIDLIAGLLRKMHDQEMVDAWVHLELIEDGGWFKNLLSGKAPWLEVALAENQCFELNLGCSKGRGSGAPNLPNNWQNKAKRLWSIPVSELSHLINWIDSFFSDVSGGVTERRLTGWIEGI